MPYKIGQNLSYWIQWQVFVCALLLISAATAAAIMIWRSKEERILKNSVLWIPCWKNLNPVWILVFRAFVVVVMGSLLIYMVSINGGFTFYFYTQWTFTLVILYFMIGTVMSAYGCWMLRKSKQGAIEYDEANGFIRREFQGNNQPDTSVNSNNVDKLQDHDAQEVHEKIAGFWGYTMQIIYQTCAGAVMLTDIVFWGLLVPMRSSLHLKVNVMMACMHSINLIFFLLDTSLNRLPFPWFRVAYFMLWSCTYVAFQWILHACGFTWWPYPFLELSTPWAPIWYVAMALVHIPCYAFYWLVVKAKNLLFPRWFPNVYIRSH